MSAFAPLVAYELTYLGHRPKTDFDPKRSFKACHSPATEVLGSASYRFDRLREGIMRRREFIALAGASVTWPCVAMVQEPGRTYRLGCLLPLARDAPESLLNDGVGV